MQNPFHQFVRFSFVAVMALFLLITLNACTTTKTQVVKESIYYHPSVPTKFFTPVIPERPIAKQDYLALPLWERETYLVNYNKSLMKNIASCNINVSSIQTVLEEAKKAADHEGQSGNK